MNKVKYLIMIDLDELIIPYQVRYQAFSRELCHQALFYILYLSFSFEWISPETKEDESSFKSWLLIKLRMLMSGVWETKSISFCNHKIF